MKKIFFYIIGFILLCFILPTLFTKNGKQVAAGISIENQNSINSSQESQNQAITSTTEKYNYNKYGTIKLLHKDTGQVEEVNLDDYLCNVVSAEMPADFELEALKAQALVARTYTIYKVNNKKHDNADICDDSACCQAWISKDDRLARWDENLRESNWNKIVEAVNSTKGLIITYNNEPINAFFHSNSGGTTEVPVNVWGGTGYPYLQTVETAGEEGYTQYSSEVTLSQEDLINKLKEKYSDITIDFSNPEDIQIKEYTESRKGENSKIWKS